MRVLVLSGGFGTRLKKVVPDFPKALAPVCGVPFLHLQIEHWLSQGLREFTFLLHYQAEQIIAFLKDIQAGLPAECMLDWLVESTPMDTGGAIAHAVDRLSLSGDFLTANADTWLGGGIFELMQSNAPAMAVVKLLNAKRYGQVEWDQNNHVNAFIEKNLMATTGWINAGLCRLSAELFKDWSGLPFSLERDLFPKLVDSQSLIAVPLNTDFIDIGEPADYFRFCRWIEERRTIPLCN